MKVATSPGLEPVTNPFAEMFLSLLYRHDEKARLREISGGFSEAEEHSVMR